MSTSLAVPKGMKVKEPTRKPDYISARGVPYWWGPEWVRKSGKSCSRILPVASEYDNTVSLHMLAKDGSLSYIRGRIQHAFIDWHKQNQNGVVPWREDMELDCILLGVDVSDLLLDDWEYE
jgi:hypothetical protein